MQHLNSLSDERQLVMSFYQPLTQGEQLLHCKLYHADTPLPLSDVLPILENLGLRVLGEFPYRLHRQDGREFWIHDFAFTSASGQEVDIQQLNDTLQDAFIHIVSGDAENDAFNRLVLTASMPWRDVALLRAYARYLKQIRLGFDLSYIASTLLNHVDIARSWCVCSRPASTWPASSPPRTWKTSSRSSNRPSSASWTTSPCSTRTASCGATST